MNRLVATLFFLYLAVFPFGQLGRIEFNPELRLHLIDVVVGAVATIGFFRWWQRKLKTPPYTREIVAFLGVAFFSLIVNYPQVNPLQFLIGSFYFARLVAYFLFYLVLWNLFRDKIWREKLSGLLLTVGFFTAFFGYLQYLFFPDLGILSDFGWDPHLFRLAGTFFDPGFAGVLIVLFMVLLFSRIWGRIGGSFLLFPFGLAALALTYSRASYFAYFMVATLFYIVRRNLVWFAGVVVALAVLIPFLPKSEGEGVNLARTSTISYRVNNYKKSLEVIGKNPVFGVGYNLYRYTQVDAVSTGASQGSIQSHGVSGTDSSLLLVLATTGVAGFVVFLQLVLKMTVGTWKKRGTQLGLALIVSLVAVAAHSLFDNSLFYPWVLGWILILLAAQD